MMDNVVIRKMLPNDPNYSHNAGIVLLAPYLPRLFDVLKFTQYNNK